MGHGALHGHMVTGRVIRGRDLWPALNLIHWTRTLPPPRPPLAPGSMTVAKGPSDAPAPGPSGAGDVPSSPSPQKALAEDAPPPAWKRAVLAVWDFLGEHWFILGLGERKKESGSAALGAGLLVCGLRSRWWPGALWPAHAERGSATCNSVNVAFL